MSKTQRSRATEVLSKDIIDNEIVPYLSQGKHGFKPVVGLYKIVQAILYKLKSDYQWSMLPIREFIDDCSYSYQSVYHHYRKWSSDGSWERVWQGVLKKHSDKLDLSSIQIDGSHTPAKKGGESLGYLGRKKCMTSNMIFLSDSLGNMLGFSPVIQGNHNDLFNIQENMDHLFKHLKGADISTADLFLNADAVFDSQALRKTCSELDLFPNIDKNKRRGQKDDMQDNEFIFDKQLYKSRFTIERANAWMDSFKSLMVRFTVKA